MADRERQTEQATPRRRQKAREEGQVARSRDLVSAASLCGVALALHFFGGAQAARMAALAQDLLSLRFGRDPAAAMRAAFWETIAVLLPVLAAGAALAAAAGAAQGGVVRRRLDVRLERVDPVAGFRRLFSSANLAEAAKGAVKLGVGGYLLWRVLRGQIPEMPALMAMDAPAMARAAGGLVMRALAAGAGCFLALGACDWAFERWRFERSLRMTKEEVRDELKEMEGNPQLKARIRSMMRDLARRRMMQEVPRATVVVTNPDHLAVALRYDGKAMPAPRIVAKGADETAARIRDVARRHGVPIVEDRPLARTLFRCEIGSYVPETLYKAVARILAQVYLRAGRPA